MYLGMKSQDMMSFKHDGKKLGDVSFKIYIML